MTIKCSRCGKMYTGSDEYDTELWFNNHVCHGLPKLSEMTTEEIIAETCNPFMEMVTLCEECCQDEGEEK